MKKLVLAIAVLALVACSKKEDDAAKGGEAAKTAETGDTSADKPAEKAGGDLELTALGLKMAAPSGATLSDAIGGKGHMVQAPGLVVSVTEATDISPKTLENGKEETEMYSPKNLVAEELEDGWLVTFENTGSAGTNYWVTVRREIDGKGYICTTTASQPEQQKNAIDACKSLKK